MCYCYHNENKNGRLFGRKRMREEWTNTQNYMYMVTNIVCFRKIAKTEGESNGVWRGLNGTISHGRALILRRSSPLWRHTRGISIGHIIDCDLGQGAGGERTRYLPGVQNHSDLAYWKTLSNHPLTQKKVLHIVPTPIYIYTEHLDHVNSNNSSYKY